MLASHVQWFCYIYTYMLLLMLSCFSRLTVWPHRRQPTRLIYPWDSLGKNTGVGCHFLLYIHTYLFEQLNKHNIYPQSITKWCFMLQKGRIWDPEPLFCKIHWKRLWCWEGLGAGGEEDNRGWDGWMASPTWWTWVWVNSGSWMDREAWCAAIHGVAKCQTKNNWTELNWTDVVGDSEQLPPPL